MPVRPSAMFWVVVLFLFGTAAQTPEKGTTAAPIRVGLLPISYFPLSVKGDANSPPQG